MPDEKSLVEKIEDKSKDLGKKVEEVLDDIAADEQPLKVTYPDDKPADPPKP